MGERTGIGWTEATWNPWHGCTKVSPGCDHCYMFTEKRQYGQDPEHVVRSKTKFNEPLKWTEPRLIFTCSWSDFFHVAADSWRAEAWDIIRRTPQHTYQTLTKRPARIRRHLPADWGDGYTHVWLGVSAEDAAWWANRTKVLRTIPARIRWVSAEPLLGPMDDINLDGIHWVVVGGESGPQHRPMDLAWLEGVVTQCREAKVPIYVKQDSGPRPGKQGRIPHELWIHEWPRLTEDTDV